MNDLIPPPDPLGIPAPVWVFETLYIVTFVLHLIFMNYVLGGSLLVMINETFMGKKTKIAKANSIMVKVMPVALSLAITMGVGPLLFVQVMYGQFFYSANIMMGGFWLLLLAFVTIAFYMIYIMIAKRGDDEMPNLWTRFGIVLNTVLFFMVAFLWTNNAILTENPEYWKDIYTGARFFIVPDITLWPRYAHNVIGAIAVAGLWMGCIGRFQARYHPDRAEMASWMEQNGLLWATIATAINIIVGFFFLMAYWYQDADLFREFMGNGIYFVGWSISLFTAIAALGHMIFALVKPQKKGLFWGAVGLIAVTLVGMAMGRALIRQISLNEYFQLSEWELNPSYSSLAMFLITFAIGLAVLGWMVYVVLKMKPYEESDHAPEAFDKPHDEFASSDVKGEEKE